jgi:hypothetical protein
MSTTIDHLVVAEVYATLAELEGGSHSAHALTKQLEDSEYLHSWTEVQVTAALIFLERKGLVVMDRQGPGWMVWSLSAAL